MHSPTYYSVPVEFVSVVEWNFQNMLLSESRSSQPPPVPIPMYGAENSFAMGSSNTVVIKTTTPPSSLSLFDMLKKRSTKSSFKNTYSEQSSLSVHLLPVFISSPNNIYNNHSKSTPSVIRSLVNSKKNASFTPSVFLTGYDDTKNDSIISDTNMELIQNNMTNNNNNSTVYIEENVNAKNINSSEEIVPDVTVQKLHLGLNEHFKNEQLSYFTTFNSSSSELGNFAVRMEDTMNNRNKENISITISLENNDISSNNNSFGDSGDNSSTELPGQNEKSIESELEFLTTTKQPQFESDFDARQRNGAPKEKSGILNTWKRFFSNDDKRRKRISSSGSSSSSRAVLLRGIVLDKYWLPLNVTESIINTTWPHLEAILEFEATPASFQNIKKAVVSIRVKPPAEGSLLPYHLYGTYEMVNTTDSKRSNKKMMIRHPQLVASKQLSSREETNLLFPVTDFIQDIVGNFAKTRTIKLVFSLHRQCDFKFSNITLAVESSILNLCKILPDGSIGWHYLKVDYFSSSEVEENDLVS